MGNIIRKYKTSLHLNFETWGENFTLNVPHKPFWDAIIRFLRKRGWKITENPSYKEHYNRLSKYHKIGFKKDLALLMEIKPKGIKVEIGNVKNLWTGIAQSFWDDPTDDRYTQLTYLENIAVNMEIRRLIDFCVSKGFGLEKTDDEYSAEEQIIRKLKINTHIHGKVESLNDIRKSITEDSYDFRHNSNDANKKKIICGEIKWFYDEYRTKRLMRGVVWHNINNMWWVILPCGTLRNEASFRLFDYDPSLPRRKKLTKEAQENKLKELASSYLKSGNFKRLGAVSLHLGKQITHA